MLKKLHNKTAFLVLVLAMLVAVLVGCSTGSNLSGDAMGNKTGTNTYLVAGKVLSPDNQPVSGAEVAILDRTYITDTNGFFQSQPLITRETITATVKAAGYITRTRFLTPDGEDIYVFFNLKPKVNTARISGRVRVLPYVPDKVNTSTVSTGNVRTMPLHQSSGDLETSSEILIRISPGLCAQSLNWQGKKLYPVKDTDMFRIRVKDQNEMDQVLSMIQQDPSVELAEPNYPVFPQASPVRVSDPYYGNQWNLEMINLPLAWTITRGSRGVKVAVLDSGIISNHPDLKGRIGTGYDFVNEDDLPDDRNGSFSHGTHVAGIIGALTDNNLGVAGINWNVSIMPVKVIGDNGLGNIEDLIQGIKYAADSGADIINMSLGTPYYSEFLHDAVKYAYDRGVILVAAAGNNGNGAVLYPARFPEVIAVGAVGPVDNTGGINLAPYSNFGPEIDVVAPGGDATLASQVLSTGGYYSGSQYHYGYQEAQGTSMAAPHVSGVVALLLANGINGQVRVRQLLHSTAKDLGEAGIDDNYGHGLIDAYAALQAEPPGEPRIFAGRKNNSKINLLSEIALAPEGSYTLQEVIPGEVSVFGWVDTDGDGNISRGDYFGEYSGPLNLKNGDSISGIDFSLYPLPEEPGFTINFN